MRHALTCGYKVSASEGMGAPQECIYLTFVCKIYFAKCERLLKFFCIEVRLASMMRAPFPHALLFGTLCALVRLALFKTKDATRSPG